ncbi:hypothetical protein [Actinomadura gamaensis]|uniref:Uncharacterized protein n=1 Tax=Actinomadura gamaensis TaxID=1763541 RepID=A0ABV9U6I5_9ACTN
MNLDFSAEPTFSWYVVMLAVSGIGTLLATVFVRGTRPRDRVLGGIIALAMVGYAFYLTFIFSGGTYHIFFYVFILPILFIVQAMKAAVAGRRSGG